MLRPKLQPPLPITWTMKDLSTAETSVQELPDGRIEFRIDHELIRGVTPAMLVWWFRTFPTATLEWGGELVPLYRIWHPRDHIRLSMLRGARGGSPGLSRGAKAAIYEQIGSKARRVVAHVAKMDETGLHLIIRRWRLKIGDLRHTFTETAGGTLYRSRLVVGSTVPGIGKLVNRLARRRTLEDGRAWLKHNVEEVGNFQFFLPRLYEEQPLRPTQLRSQAPPSASTKP